MTDLEIVRLCAQAMGMAIGECISEYRGGPRILRATPEGALHEIPYDPLHDDGQCMALLKRLDIVLLKPHKKWQAILAKDWNGGERGSVFHAPYGEDENLNRAVCECVAKHEPTDGESSRWVEKKM